MLSQHIVYGHIGRDLAQSLGDGKSFE